jgi:hypothetical protein
VETKEFDTICKALYDSMYRGDRDEVHRLGIVEHYYEFSGRRYKTHGNATDSSGNTELLERVRKQVDIIEENATTDEAANVVLYYFNGIDSMASKSYATWSPIRKLIRVVRRCAQITRKKERREEEAREKAREDAIFDMQMKNREKRCMERKKDTARRVAILATMPNLTSIPSG